MEEGRSAFKVYNILEFCRQDESQPAPNYCDLKIQQILQNATLLVSNLSCETSLIICQFMVYLLTTELYEDEMK